MDGWMDGRKSERLSSVYILQPISGISFSYCRCRSIEIFYKIWRLRWSELVTQSPHNIEHHFFLLIHLLTHSRFMPLRSNQGKKNSFCLLSLWHQNTKITIERDFLENFTLTLIWYLSSIVIFILFRCCFGSFLFDTCHNSRLFFHTYLLVRFRKLQAVRCQRDKNI